MNLKELHSMVDEFDAVMSELEADVAKAGLPSIEPLIFLANNRICAMWRDGYAEMRMTVRKYGRMIDRKHGMLNKFEGEVIHNGVTIEGFSFTSFTETPCPKLLRAYRVMIEKGDVPRCAERSTVREKS